MIHNDSKGRDKEAEKTFETIFLFVSHLLFIIFIVVSFLKLTRAEQIITLLSFLASIFLSAYIAFIIDTILKPEQTSKQGNPEDKDE